MKQALPKGSSIPCSGVTLPLLALLAMAAASCGGDDKSLPDAVQDLATSDVETDLGSDTLPLDVTDLNLPESVTDVEPTDLNDVEVQPAPVYANAVVFPVQPAEVELPAGARIRVVSFNVYGGKMGTAQAIGTYLAGLDVDLVGLQECAASFGAEIAAAGGFPFTYGDGTFMMSMTSLQNTQSVALLTGRGCVRAETVIGGVPFTFYNTHLGWNVDGNLQFRLFTDEYLKNDGSLRIVMTGDFNDEHYSTQNTIMEEWGTECFTAAGIYPGQRISWPSFGFDDTEGSQLIDLVWFRKDFQPIVISAAPQNVPGLLSDHKPVLAELLYPAGDSPFAQDPYAEVRDPWRGFPAELPANLLTNPGAEEGMEGWSAEGGATWAEAREHQTARTGQRMFAGSPEALLAGTYWSSGTQEVDLAGYAGVVDEGRGVLFVSGYLTTGYQTEERDGEVSNIPKPYDDAELVLEWKDAAGKVLGRWSSGRRDTLGWHAAQAVVALPAGTRSAALTWMSHLKEGNGPTNDGLVDDLYLGFGAVETGHDVLGPSLLAGGGAEGSSAVAEGIADVGAGDGKNVWSMATDLLPMGPWGIYPYAPWSWSGKGFFVATSKGLPKAERPGAWGRLCWDLDLSAYAADVDLGLVDVVAGAKLRNYNSVSGVSLRLELGEPLGDPVTPQILAAEWTPVEFRTQVPSGLRTGRLCLEATLTGEEDPVFADQVFALPIRHSAQ